MCSYIHFHLLKWKAKKERKLAALQPFAGFDEKVLFDLFCFIALLGPNTN